MRDGNRLKEKIELRLDRRQVVSTAVGLLVYSAAVFALGVIVGNKLSPPPGAPADQRGLLDRLDARADGKRPSPTSPGREAGDGLTFQQELTRPVVTEAPPAKAQAKHAPPKKEPAGKGPPPATAATVAGQDGGTRSSEAPSPVLAPAGGEGLAGAAARASASATFFTIQAKATQSKADADRFVKTLAGKGLHPFVAEVDIPGKGHWYRVRVGRFDNRAKADRYLADFERETRVAAFVTAAGH